jgi:hypothetical protein
MAMTSPAQGFLSEIKPYEVSLVKWPANRREFLLTKNEDKSMDELLRIVEEIEAKNEEGLIESLTEAKASEKTIEIAKTVARLISAHSEDFDSTEYEMIGKSLGFFEDETEEIEITKSELEKLPARLRVKVEKLQDDLNANVTVTSELVERLDKKEEDERRQSFIEKVEGIELGIKAEKLADLVQYVADKDDAAADELVTALKSASALAEKSEAFKEVGSSAEGDDVTDDPYEKIRQIALSKVEADSTLTMPKALESAMKENPELKKAYVDQARG